MVLATLVVGACTSRTEDRTTKVPVEPTTGIVEAGWLLHSNGPPGTWLAALLVGEVRIDMDGRCVTVLHQGDHESPVVWVDGAGLDVTDPAVPVLVRHNGDRYRDGDYIQLGGGSWGTDPNFSTRTEDYRHIDIPPNCRTGGVWIAAPVQ